MSAEDRRTLLFLSSLLGSPSIRQLPLDVLDSIAKALRVIAESGRQEA